MSYEEYRARARKELYLGLIEETTNLIEEVNNINPFIGSVANAKIEEIINKADELVIYLGDVGEEYASSTMITVFNRAFIRIEGCKTLLTLAYQTTHEDTRIFYINDIAQEFEQIKAIFEDNKPIELNGKERNDEGDR